jgi:hypothetical protein
MKIQFTPKGMAGIQQTFVILRRRGIDLSDTKAGAAVMEEVNQVIDNCPTLVGEWDAWCRRNGHPLKSQAAIDKFSQMYDATER